MSSKITNFKDLQVEFPNRYEKTENGIKTDVLLDFKPGDVFQEGTFESAEVFNNINKNGVYQVTGNLKVENSVEIFDIFIDGIDEFQFETLQVIFNSNLTNNKKNPVFRLNNVSYLSKLEANEIEVQQRYLMTLDKINNVAFVASRASNKLDKGGYTGTAKDLENLANSGIIPRNRITGDINSYLDRGIYMLAIEGTLPNTPDYPKGAYGYGSILNVKRGGTNERNDFIMQLYKPHSKYLNNRTQTRIRTWHNNTWDNWEIIPSYIYNEVMTIQGQILATDNITAYSDIKLKDNLEVISNPLEKISKISGYTYTRNDIEDKEKRHTGVIAQEVLEVLPEVIEKHTDDKGEETLSVAYGNMVGLLIEAIKEQQKQIDELKAKIGGV